PRQIYNGPATRFVASFIGEANIFEGKAVAAGGTGAAIEWKGRTLTGRSPLRPVAQGSPASMIVRPEDIRLVQITEGEAQHQDDPLVGKVIDEVYGGSHVRIMVQLNSGNRLYARVDNDQAGMYPVGSTVRVTWPEGTPILVAGD